VLAQPVVEKTDSTIARIFYPERDLKLWYGNETFRVNNFVVLPKYTLLYNQESSTLRLLGNQENLVEDEVSLLAIKTIKPCNVNNQKWALSPTTSWFTVLTDSTVQVGTALFMGRKEVAGYLLVTIKNNKLFIDHKQFNLDSKVDNIDPNNMQFISHYIDYKGTQLYSSSILLPPTPKNKFVVSESVYGKTSEKPLSVYFSRQQEAEEPVEKRQLIPFQLIVAIDRLLIYDSKREQLRVATNDIANSVLFDITSSLPDNLPKGKLFSRAFMVDRVTGQMYYKTLGFMKESTDQLVMSVKLDVNKIAFVPLFRATMSHYFCAYINNRRMFFHDSKRGYIYTTKTDLPE